MVILFYFKIKNDDIATFKSFFCFLFATFVQVVWLGTCIASILLGLDLGLAVGLSVELISVVLRTQL